MDKTFNEVKLDQLRVWLQTNSVEDFRFIATQFADLTDEEVDNLIEQASLPTD